ncbi:MAG TPA: T9SS type A sorting domain-containing protein, partial [Ignavibacteria bacterium]|nr:T9SS type A sorting domain-containing protein [Ignavibacteria bacterium]
LVDYSNPLRVYASSQTGGLGRSTDGGNSFQSGTNGLDATYTNWMTPYVLDKNNPLILYCGTYKIHKSTNGMQSWTAISPDLANAHRQNLGTITTVDVSKSNPNVVYCGTDDANVWVTTNGGTNWSKINSGLPYRWVTRVAVHPDSANVCYVTLSGYKVDSTGSHIFRTTNYGTNWTSIKGNLPDAPVNDVIIDPANTNSLFIGTDINVMYTNNLGANWYVLGTGIPSNVPCQDLTFHNPSRMLVVWTHGRSAFKTVVPITGIQNNVSNVPLSFKLEQNYPNPFNPSTTIMYSIPNTKYLILKVYDALGKEVAVLVNEKKSPGSYQVEFDGNDFSSGIYFYSLQVDGKVFETRSMVLLK